MSEPMQQHCNGWFAQPAEQSSAANIFRQAAALAPVKQVEQADLGENQRLANMFRSGNVTAIAAEPELIGAAEVLELAQDYFSGTSDKNRNPADVASLVCDLRNLLADEIAHGMRPVLKPEFKQEFTTFKCELMMRREKAPAPDAQIREPGRIQPR